MAPAFADHLKGGFFTYENLGPVRARWAQAFSPDSGRSWETNWIMEFSRMGQN